MISITRDKMKGGIIFMYWNKSRLVTQQNINIFLGADYTTYTCMKLKEVKAATVILFNYEIF